MWCLWRLGTDGIVVQVEVAIEMVDFHKGLGLYEDKAGMAVGLEYGPEGI